MKISHALSTPHSIDFTCTFNDMAPLPSLRIFNKQFSLVLPQVFKPGWRWLSKWPKKETSQIYKVLSLLNFWRLIMWTTIFQSKWKSGALLAVKFVYKLPGLWVCHPLFWSSIRTRRAEVNQPLVRGLSDKWPKGKRGREVKKQRGIWVWTPGFGSYLCCTLASGGHLANLLRVHVLVSLPLS